VFSGSLFFQAQEAEAQFSTKLRISVLDELGNAVEGAEVSLYKTRSDYEKEVHVVQKTMISDDKGRVLFKQLDAISYYVIVRKGEKDNIGGGEIISALEPKRLNKVNVIISDGL
jgi:hypothetical protein